MLTIQENIPLGPKTTMRIGGLARFYAELQRREEAEEAARFAQERHYPLLVLGGGSNTVFADGLISALVVRILADCVTGEGNEVHVEAGKNLAQLVNELAELGLDLSPLTGIPGTVGGAIFGNAGQGYGGTWIGHYVKEVEIFTNDKRRAPRWERLSTQDCQFGYRVSVFKTMLTAHRGPLTAPLIWSATLSIPSRPKAEITAEIDRLLRQRLKTQPHVKTAGSCFLSVAKEMPAWKLIDAAGLRGKSVGRVAISEKHANFLIAEKGATFEDAKELVHEVRRAVKHPLAVEMRFIEENAHPAF